LNTLQNEFSQPVGAPLTSWQGARQPARITLEGRYCRLVPVDADQHLPALAEAYNSAEDGRDWTYLSTGPFNALEDYRAHFQKLSATSDPLHFAVIDRATDTALGTLALMRIDTANGVIEVGHIAFSPRLKKTRIATEAIFLLMRHVFDDLGNRRFEWKCDSLNGPSRTAAQRFGFTFEGIFRQAIVYKGRSRDTAWFSIIDAEWPALKARYERWLDPKNFDANGTQIERLATAAKR
jgi:RimJ/RimL family protein N-acetyltransferase